MSKLDGFLARVKATTAGKVLTYTTCHECRLLDHTVALVKIVELINPWLWHDPECAAHEGKPCNCPIGDVLEEIEALVPEEK